MDPIVAKCDAVGCENGYIDGRQCWKCDGNGKIVIGDIPEPKKAERGAHWMTWIAIVILCGVIAYLIGHGGK